MGRAADTTGGPSAAGGMPGEEALRVLAERGLTGELGLTALLRLVRSPCFSRSMPPTLVRVAVPTLGDDRAAEALLTVADAWLGGHEERMARGLAQAATPRRRAARRTRDVPGPPPTTR